MPEYLAFYTVYLAQSQSDKRHFRSSFKMNPKTFRERENWGYDLITQSQYRFEAQNEKHAIKCAKFHGDALSAEDNHSLRIGATLDELLEIKPIEIKNC